MRRGLCKEKTQQKIYLLLKQQTPFRRGILEINQEADC